MIGCVTYVVISWAGWMQDSANNLPAGSKSTYLLNIGDMSYAGAQ